MERLTECQREHPFWDCDLLRACQAGQLTKDDFRVVFSQYLLYSRNFTRLIAGLMASCESDYFRARLAENLWEEGGGREPAQRHSEIFRRFLANALQVDIGNIAYQSFTQLFVHRYLDFCRQAPAHAVAAFLSLGTEGIVPRVYGIFCDGLLGAGVPENELRFFRIHMECDDEHAATLSEMMQSFAGRPGWYEDCREALHHALELRREFFDEVYRHVRGQRLEPLFQRVQGSADTSGRVAGTVKASADPQDPANAQLYQHLDPMRGIGFVVGRVPFDADVLDVRTVAIAEGHTNELHRHAHESLLVVTEGSAEIRVGDLRLRANPSEAVFVPRWVLHQTRNCGKGSLRMFAITDFNLTRRVCCGDGARTPREVPENDRETAPAVASA